MYTILRKWYLDLPIRRKILLWFVPLLVVTIMATGLYSFRIASNEITDKMEAEQLNTAKQAIDHLDFIAQDAVNISNYLFLTPEIQALLRPDPVDGGYVTNQTVFDSINRLMVTRPYFQFLTVYSTHFAPIQFNNKGLSSAIPFEEYRSVYDYENILKNPKIESWSVEVPGRKKSIFYGDTKIKLLLTKVLKNNSTYKPEGILLLGIDEKDIRKSYTPPEGNVEIAVVNTDGTVLSDSSGKWVGTSINQMPYFDGDIQSPSQIGGKIDTSKWVFAHVESAITGWHILVVQPRSELLKQLNRITWVTVCIVFLTLVLSVFVSFAVSGVIIDPMRKILTSMKKFQKGNFSEQVDLEGQDEIGQLGAGYNIMVQRIRELVDDVYSFELKQKQAELKVLQSQINPHFLYNTLNTIAWTAQKNGDRQVGDMIYALSGIFKLSLNQGKDIINLQQEFKLLEHYLFLQKMRSPNKLAYELNLSPELEDYAVPKLLLQPLVENAVVHGIEPLTDELGFIEVNASITSGSITIEITDNGIGITAEKLEELLQISREGKPPPGSEGFAIANICKRIRIYYGESAAFNIQSIPGSGTRVLLVLPDNRR
ncbi:sensor histidine kinase [Paenibacillus solisilvae]|uniref:histidine kinase n=1 Tax=Paenibacillus solisilvae TaxID=2486751 RepID=A0ABW0VT35_9BACL